MSTDGVYLPMPELLARLRRLCGESASGTVFIATPENRSARIALRDGAIVGLNYRAKRGMASVEMIREIGSGRIGFSEDLLEAAGADQDLPATPVLLSLLDPGRGPRAAAPDPARPAALASVDLGLARQAMEQELIEYLGPVAGFACAEAFARLPVDVGLDDLIAIIGRILEEGGEARHTDEVVQGFLARLRQQ